jgi:nanoRNase/pAp phosphatase (c-di-AMP/oligoRNAs hydrolase)
MDVSEIAKSFGGGGHRKAAGFVLPNTIHPDSIFTIVEEEEEQHILSEDEYGAD